VWLVVGGLDVRTFPTAASPNRTNLTLLLGFGVDASLILGCGFKI
jgi:hypothetical protein